jgi:hypothetical protein
MLSTNTYNALSTAIADDSVTPQLQVLLTMTTPGSTTAAKAILAQLNLTPFGVLTTQSAITTAAGDTYAGNELLNGFTQAITALQAYVAGNTPALAAAQAAIYTMTNLTYLVLVDMLCGDAGVEANEIQADYNSMVAAVKAIP